MPREFLSGNQAAAWAAKFAKVDFVAAYPITPQTEAVETLARFCAEREMKADFVRVESEHSAMAASVAASQAGARVFTATSSQGLALMCEMLHWASGARLPIVLYNVNRALGPGWNVWNDHTDSLSQRDAGWIQFYCSSAQEVFDSVIQAFWIAEKSSLPVMVCADGFLLSHAYEPVDIPEQESVDHFLGKRNPIYKIEPGQIFAFGAICMPPDYAETRKRLFDDFRAAEKIVKAAEREYQMAFGRSYPVLETYSAEDAELLLIISGSVFGVVQEAVDRLRQDGYKVGALRLRMFRPFPVTDLRRLTCKARKLVVVDENSHQIIFEEVKSALYESDSKPELFPYTMGVGGDEISVADVLGVFKEAFRNQYGKERSVWKIHSESCAPEELGNSQTESLIVPASGDPLFFSGHSACPGCAATIPMRHILEVLGEDSVCVIPASCWSIINGPYPTSALGIPVIHCAFETAAVTAGAIKRVFKRKGKDSVVFVCAGDGGTFDIGLQALSAAAERNEDIVYVCYDNEGYTNTGGQASSSTPLGALTETTPTGKTEERKDIMAIMAAHKIPYAATVSPAFFDDMMAKFRKAASKKGQGLRFLHVLSPCPRGWGFPASDSVKMARLAVMSNTFPLYEIERSGDGHSVEMRLLDFGRDAVPVEEYLRPQDRFSRLTDEDIKVIQRKADLNWKMLKDLMKMHRYL